ncbi:amidase signature domain-containing protein [Biscogniauxia marginata]|nr:amidase signature domain-containing protein [Biscogniauxia marginata]
METLEEPVGHRLDVVTATAGDLRQLLEDGKYTSVELVHHYLTQISRHNHDGMKLYAVTATAPVRKLLEEAMDLDVERLVCGARSRLHGIPITLKDFFLTPSFGMDTTCGSFALKGLKASEDATIATMLKEAGAIVIALDNLSEWANCKGSNLTAGWSAFGGQTQSPYVSGGVDPKDKWLGHSTPGGSSSGSAVGTTAGFSPISIGSESDGSIVQPAIRASLYSMKGTVGDINMKGTMSGGAGFDSAGPIAKSVDDIADVMDILLPGRYFRSYLTKSWQGLRIAYLDYKTWQFADWICDPTPAFDEEHEAAMINAMKRAEMLGAQVVFNAPLLLPSKIIEKYGTVQPGELFNHELPVSFRKFLALFNDPNLRTLEDLVDFNKNHAELELPSDHPSQSQLEQGLRDNMTDEEYESGLQHLRQSFCHAVDKCLQTAGADVIMASGESYLTSIASGAGYPIASVPLGLSSYNGRPHGMEIMACNGEEEHIFRVMSAWETTFPEARIPPPSLLQWHTESDFQEYLLGTE